MVSSTRQRTAQRPTTDTKTKQHKAIKFTERRRIALASMPKALGDTPLLPGERSHRMPRASLQRAWNAACETARHSNFHVHDIRHISLSLVAEIGEDWKVIQQSAGHASMTSTDHYIHTSKKQHATAVDGWMRTSPISATMSAPAPYCVRPHAGLWLRKPLECFTWGVDVTPRPGVQPPTFSHGAPGGPSPRARGRRTGTGRVLADWGPGT